LIAARPPEKLGKLFVKKARHEAFSGVIFVPYAEYFPLLERKLHRFPSPLMQQVPPLRILLAEDEAPVAFAIGFALKAAGHRVETVTNGEHALARLIAAPEAFDLLITDNNMPGMTGVELVRRLRERTFDGKILVLSAHLSREIRAAYDSLGVNGMMPKPFDVHELRAEIRRIVAYGVASLLQKPPPIELSPAQVCGLLKLGLKDEDAL
jgi:CheY-like chemotaxis protein